MKYSFALLARIVAIPLNDSVIIAKIGDLATPSTRLSPPVLVTKIFLTTTKYHVRGGITTNTNGRVTKVVKIAPITMKNNSEKSKIVCGNISSFDPTSAENRFNIRPILIARYMTREAERVRTRKRTDNDDCFFSFDLTDLCQKMQSLLSGRL